ncbi:MAG: hypothetical protein R2712_23405 [Vicinamibacterales bacterium]
MRGRSSARCSATTTPSPRCPARSCRRASSTTTSRSKWTRDPGRSSPPSSPTRSGRPSSASRSRAFRAIDGARLSRVDFLLSRSSGSLVLNEINTMPGFTTISMYAKLWEASGVGYAALIDRLIALALERHQEKQRLRTSVL